MGPQGGEVRCLAQDLGGRREEEGEARGAVLPVEPLVGRPTPVSAVAHPLAARTGTELLFAPADRALDFPGVEAVVRRRGQAGDEVGDHRGREVQLLVGCRRVQTKGEARGEAPHRAAPELDTSLDGGVDHSIGLVDFSANVQRVGKSFEERRRSVVSQSDHSPKTETTEQSLLEEKVDDGLATRGGLILREEAMESNKQSEHHYRSLSLNALHPPQGLKLVCSRLRGK